jgi:hypothetical protein
MVHPRVISGELKPRSIAFENPLAWPIDDWAPALRPYPHMESFWKSYSLTHYGYELLYKEQRLSCLAADFILSYYDNCVLLCHEMPGMFCHRHIVRKWIYEQKGVVIEELGHPDMRWPESFSTKAMFDSPYLDYSNTRPETPAVIARISPKIEESIQLSLF